MINLDGQVNQEQMMKKWFMTPNLNVRSGQNQAEDSEQFAKSKNALLMAAGLKNQIIQEEKKEEGSNLS
jgi:hypothetical protein